MPGVQRKGDPNGAGGTIMSGIPSVLVNGRPIATTGMPVSPHPCCGAKRCPPTHCSAKTTKGSSTVKAGGKSVSLTGNSDSCGHSRTGGSPNVKAV